MIRRNPAAAGILNLYFTRAERKIKIFRKKRRKEEEIEPQRRRGRRETQRREEEGREEFTAVIREPSFHPKR